MSKKKNHHWVIYDQFHWLKPDHLERHVTGTWDEALEQYRFYRAAFPNESLGLTDIETFNKKKQNYERTRQEPSEASN